MKIRVIQVGLGPVGRMLTPFLRERTGLELVGAVDILPDLVGKEFEGVRISGSIADAPDADVAVITTVSGLVAIEPLLLEAAEKKLHVVSTCEEMVYPWQRQPEIAKRIDEAAKAAGVAMLATGVNPGFLMDALVLTATGICRNVQKLHVERIQDASKRRLPFQQKIGAGLTREEFQAKVASGKFGHVGLTESMQMIAHGLGWKLDRTIDLIEPVIGPDGKAIGLSQKGRGWRGEEQVLTLDFRAAMGEAESRDTIRIDGAPPFEMTIPGGIHGDVATCAITTNAIFRVVEAKPGLRTMLDLPMVRCAQD